MIKNWLEYSKESPDRIKLPSGLDYHYNNENARAFGYLEGEMKVGLYGDHHPGMLYDEIWKPGLQFNKNDVAEYFKYPGRIYENVKVITFWQYPPSKRELKKVIQDIEKAAKIPIWDHGWWLEIVKENDKILTNLEYDWSNEKYHTEFITLEDYEGSLNFSEEVRKRHQTSPLQKTKRPIPKGFGSKNRSDLKWRQKHYQERIIFNFKHFLMENLKVDMPIPNEIHEVSNLYHEAGKDLYIVGGAVRDFLQGKTPHDYDLVTNALPEESKKILKGWNLSDEQGKSFGVLRLYTENEPEGYEIATYRKDISKGRDTKGDDPKVEIGKHLTIEDDVKRRDLTINALFYDINRGEIVDLVGGIQDLKKGVVRTVGKPQARFDEDRLRILRTFRFAARSESEIAPETAEAIRKDNRLRGVSGKDDVSQERIVEEFFKMLGHAQSNQTPGMMFNYLKMLEDFRMWPQMFPTLEITNIDNRMATLDPIVLTTNLFENTPNLTKQMVINGFASKLAKKSNYLKEFKQKITDENQAYYLLKEALRNFIKKDTLIEFALFNQIPKNVLDKFLKYLAKGPSIKGEEVMKAGFEGADIGLEIYRRELEIYKNI